MKCATGIRFKLLARLCPDATGAEIASVCREAGMFCVRNRGAEVVEGDFVKAIEKVIKGDRKSVV